MAGMTELAGSRLLFLTQLPSSAIGQHTPPAGQARQAPSPPQVSTEPIRSGSFQAESALVAGLAAVALRRRGRVATRALPREHSPGIGRQATASAIPPPDVVAPVEEEERRLNSFDGRIYTLDELRSWGSRVSLTEEELMEHWHNRCHPIVLPGGEAGDGAATVSIPEAPQTKAWREMWSLGSLWAVWTDSDAGHVHAISGGLYMFLGALFLLDSLSHDLMVVNGFEAGHLIPQEVALFALALGVLNALSGLQPRLLGARDPLAGLGMGPEGSTRSGGYVNCSLFFLILAYQCVRALPGFPPFIAMFDIIVGLASVMTMGHTAFILDSWVRSGAIHRVDALVLPNLLNLPVAWQLLFSGGTFVEQLAARNPNWPELFFSANFAVAWALSAVTFALSLHERRVISQELRGLLMLGLPLLVFPVIPLRAAVLVPEWLQTDLAGLLLLHAPQGI